MNKKGGIGDILLDNVLHIIFVALFLTGMVLFVSGQQEGADIWAQFYSEEIVRVVDLSEPGSEIELEVGKSTEIALKKEVGFKEIFEFDNTNNELCVKLSRGRRNCFSYFNDVDVVACELRLAVGGQALNLLSFEISEDRGTEFVEQCEVKVG